MHIKDIRLHFKTEEVYQGLARADGFLYTDEEHLIMEFQVKDNLFGVLKSKPKLLKIPLAKVSDARYKRNLFISKFRFSVNDLELLSQFPETKNGRISVSVHRRDKELVRALVAYLRGEAMVERLDNVAYNDPFLGK